MHWYNDYADTNEKFCSINIMIVTDLKGLKIVFPLPNLWNFRVKLD